MNLRRSSFLLVTVASLLLCSACSREPAVAPAPPPAAPSPPQYDPKTQLQRCLVYNKVCTNTAAAMRLCVAAPANAEELGSICLTKPPGSICAGMDRPLPCCKALTDDLLASCAQALAPVAVTALQLWKDYDDNEVAADGKYRGHALDVSGKVARIDKDMFDHTVVRLVGNRSIGTVDAVLGAGQDQAAGALRKGQQVTVHCAGKGRSVGDPQLDGCRL
jgi:hypothetical protein